MSPREWLVGLAPRDRRVLLIGAAAAGVLLAFALLWRLETAVTGAEARVTGKRDDLAWIEAVTPRLRAMPAARPGESLAIAIDRIARETGLSTALAGIEPAQPGTLRVRLQAASFDALVLCLARLQQERGASAEGATVSAADTAGRVDATFILRGH
ncbi:MAG: type II secretion system protein M [Gammaproteobacteria bacterium]|nr:type II secretion system protein M [Gammaproteobacteria bacterium]